MPFRTKIPIPCPYDTVFLKDAWTRIVIFYIRTLSKITVRLFPVFNFKNLNNQNGIVNGEDGPVI